MASVGGRFPRSARVRRSREFQEISRRGQRRSSANFVVLRRESPSDARLGVTVSRKVGNAVVRNRVKRRIREWFRQGGQERVGAHDVVVIARPRAAALGGPEIAAELDALMSPRAGKRS
ncbi:MAG: ribonuclease P protein component [Myxococcota bacterium]